MAAPAKPWETSSHDESAASNFNRLNFVDSSISGEKPQSSLPPMVSITGEPSIQTERRPIVPPRNYGSAQQPPISAYSRPPYYQRPYGSYGSYGSYSSYGYGATQPYYSSFGGGTPYNTYGNHPGMRNPESRFVRAAEENVRPTFQAIESLTRAINSIAFMMESTIGSLNMSFQAVLSVIENFSQVRTFLKHAFGSLLALRLINKFYVLLLNMMRKMNLISQDTSAKFIWTHLEKRESEIGAVSKKITAWPLFAFLGLMFGIPYFISKMLPNEEKVKTENDWNPAVDASVPLLAAHDFQAANEQEMTIRRGERLKMIPPEICPPSSPYWVFVANDSGQTGYIPRNHVVPA